MSKRFAFVELDPAGHARSGGAAPYLDYQGLAGAELPLVAAVFEQEWLRRGVEDVALAWAVEHSLAQHAADVRTRITSRSARVRREVDARLTAEINRWDAEHARLLDLVSAGKQVRMRPETAEKRARDLEVRLARRLSQLDADEQLTVHPPVVAGAALVVPQGLLSKLAGASATEVAMFARNTEAVERRAVDLVLASERSLGAAPEEMPHDNPGYDVRSVRPDGTVVRIEVKGRVRGADTFTITKNEVVMGKNMGDDYRLALVAVGDEPAADEVRYLTHPFDDTDAGDFSTVSFNQSWTKTWERGGPAR